MMANEPYKEEIILEADVVAHQVYKLVKQFGSGYNTATFSLNKFKTFTMKVSSDGNNAHIIRLNNKTVTGEE